MPTGCAALSGGRYGPGIAQTTNGPRHAARAVLGYLRARSGRLTVGAFIPKRHPGTLKGRGQRPDENVSRERSAARVDRVEAGGALAVCWVHFAHEHADALEGVCNAP